MFFRIINYIVLAISFVVVSAVIVIYAAGYKIDFTNRQISQTVTVEVAAVTNDASIYINNILEGTGKVTKRGLPAGHYKIDVKKEGYYPWTKEIDVAAGRAEVIDDPILFLEEAVIEEFSLDGTNESLEKISETDGLGSAEGEIYQNGTFVTRFGSDITGLCWYADRRYLAFSQDGWLKIMSINGTNITNIVAKDSAGPVVFVNSGRSVIYESSGKFYRAQIR